MSTTLKILYNSGLENKYFHFDSTNFGAKDMMTNYDKLFYDFRKYFLLSEIVIFLQKKILSLKLTRKPSVVSRRLFVKRDVTFYKTL